MPESATELLIPELPQECTPQRSALNYARAGWFVLPTSPDDIKNPGSVVGKGWQNKSTRDPEQIKEWWPRGTNRGVVLHVGRSGALVVDVDRPEFLPEWLSEELRDVPWQSTSKDGTRRHYLFLQPAGRELGNSAGGLRGMGLDVRGKNGVIAVYPTPHPKPDGEYRWGNGGHLTEPPESIVTRLKDATETAPTISTEEAQDFFTEHTSNRRPNALKGVLQSFDRGMRHESMRDALAWAFREAAAGCFPAHKAHDDLRKLWDEAFRADAGRRPPADEWDRLVCWAVAQAAAADPVETRTKVERDENKDNRPRFVAVSARDLAQPVPPMEWLVRDVWPSNSFGPMGGEKKTLKTYNLLAFSLAVASGEPLFGRFAVEAPGPVLYFVGEGGRFPFQRRLQRVADAYKLDNDALADLPFAAVFEAGALDGEDFRAALTAYLDTLQPSLVVIDPLYAYHPPGVEATNLYERGRMLSDVSGLVADRCALIIADHFRKTNSDKLDLDSIAQAGMAQWADSWILQRHREPAELSTGLFKLAVEFGSRQWGGARYGVDWTIPNPGEDLDRAAPITWRVDDLADGDETRPASTKEGRLAKAERRVLEVVSEQPFELTSNAVIPLVGGNAGTVRDAIDRLLGMRLIESKKVSQPDARGRSVARERLGPAADPARIKVRAERSP